VKCVNSEERAFLLWAGILRKAPTGSDEECEMATMYTNIKAPERLDSYFGREYHAVLVLGL
jgi:hypothetical protein